MKHADGTIYDAGRWIIQILVQSDKKSAGKKTCNCCFRGVAICFLARLYHALITSTAKRVCDCVITQHTVERTRNMKSTNADFHTCFLTETQSQDFRTSTKRLFFKSPLIFFLLFLDPPLRRIWPSKASYFSKEQQLLPSSKGKAVYTCVVLHEVMFKMWFRQTRARWTSVARGSGSRVQGFFHKLMFEEPCLMKHVHQ